MDSWEEGFDEWTPRARNPPDAGDDTDTDLDRVELLRLARELAERRQAGQTSSHAEVEQLKQSLRERAEAIATRERELTALQRRLEGHHRPSVRGKLDELRARRGEQREAVDEAALAARERATLERAQELEQREQELAERERELAAELTTAPDPRPQEPIEQAGDAVAQLAEVEQRERALARRESELEARERALGRREVADVGESPPPPFAPPSFSEGLAALARGRSRGV